MDSSPFVGHIDAIENGEIYGWALNVQVPSQSVTVSIYVDGTLAAEALAGYYRPDVAKALSCSGRNGFYVEVDSLCHVGQNVAVDVRFPDGSRIEGGPIIHKATENRARADGPTLLFLHIPKTAGTAFREVVMRNYRQSEVMYMYGDPPGFPVASLRDIPLQQRARLRLVFGHYGYGVHCDMPNACDYAALIRHPVYRIWSHYTHLVRDGNPAAVFGTRPKRIEEMLEERESVYLDNLYVRYFCGLEEAVLPPGSITGEIYEQALKNAKKPNVFLRAQEDLTSAYNSLAEELGWIQGLDCPRVNVSPLPNVLPGPKEIQAIRHFNAWDFKLYEDLV